MQATAHMDNAVASSLARSAFCAWEKEINTMFQNKHVPDEHGTCQKDINPT